MTQELLLLKSAVGLSRIGLMNPLAQSRQLPRNESFCSYVVDSHQVFAIHDTANNPVFANSLLVGHYGIRAYLGAPLLTADGQCLGTLAVMDWQPRCFTTKDSEFLAITARWSLSEYERNRLLKQACTSSVHWLPEPSAALQYQKEWESSSTSSESDVSNGLSTCLTSTHSIKVNLLTHLTQELRTPLTSVMGMASVLTRQVYGPLTSKQKEYLDIIHRSGQQLVSMVDEIVALSLLDESSEKLHLTSVDIEMLCQQAINSLLEIAQAKQQQIRLSVEPGSRIWLLDKDKVRQMLYYLVYSVINSAEAEVEVRLHISRKSDKLNIAVWTSHPWLEDSLPQVYGEIAESLLPPQSPTAAVSNTLDSPMGTGELESSELAAIAYLSADTQELSSASLWTALTLTQELNKTPGNHNSRESLGLLLSCHLAELHGGKISVQPLLESGFRYVVSLPKLESGDKRL
jgi:signal transduction histidine kinase